MHRTKDEWVSYMIANGVPAALDQYPQAIIQEYLTFGDDHEPDEEPQISVGIQLPNTLVQALQANRERSQAAWTYVLDKVGV